MKDYVKQNILNTIGHKVYAPMDHMDPEEPSEVNRALPGKHFTTDDYLDVDPTMNYSIASRACNGLDHLSNYVDILKGYCSSNDQPTVDKFVDIKPPLDVDIKDGEDGVPMIPLTPAKNIEGNTYHFHVLNNGIHEISFGKSLMNHDGLTKIEVNPNEEEPGEGKANMWLDNYLTTKDDDQVDIHLDEVNIYPHEVNVHPNEVNVHPDEVNVYPHKVNVYPNEGKANMWLDNYLERDGDHCPPYCPPEKANDLSLSTLFFKDCPPEDENCIPASNICPEDCPPNCPPGCSEEALGLNDSLVM